MFRRYSLITFSRCHIYIYKASGRHRLDRREKELVMEKHDSGVGDLECEVGEYVKSKNSARNQFLLIKIDFARKKKSVFMSEKSSYFSKTRSVISELNK